MPVQPLVLEVPLREAGKASEAIHSPTHTISLPFWDTEKVLGFQTDARGASFAAGLGEGI